jgi:hypothetical protein
MGMPEKRERNEALVRDRRDGVSVKELKRKYGINHQRVYQILKASKAAYDVSPVPTTPSAAESPERIHRGPVGPHQRVTDYRDFPAFGHKGPLYVVRCDHCGEVWPEGGNYPTSCPPSPLVTTCVITPDMPEPDA